MICYTDKLDAAINTGCPTTFGMERNGYLCLRSEINPKTENGLVVDFVPRFMIPVYQPSENAYKPKSDGEKNAYGLTKFQKSIEVFLVSNTTLSQEQIMWLKDEDWVAVLKQRDETIIVFGFERGLRLKTTSQDLNSTETHGGILLTFDENQVNSPMLFGDETLYDWQDLDTIYGGTIANGGAVKLSIDTDKIGYAKLPNGTVLTTVAGVINTTYSGISGKITKYVPKINTTEINCSYAGSVGDIIYSGVNNINLGGNSYASISCLNVTGYIVCNTCANLQVLIAPKSPNIDASLCALTAKSIGDIIYSAYVDNREDVIYDFSGGTNALYNDIDTYLDTISSVSLYDMLSVLRTNGGVISLNGEA